MSEIAPNERVLDRKEKFDERSRGFTIRQFIEEHAPRRSRSRQPGPTLDQGREGACTGFALAHVLNASPAMTKPAHSNNVAREFYIENRRHDEWEGEEYEGSSVLGAMKTAHKRGLIREYRWLGAGSNSLASDLYDTLTKVGPIEFGTDWLESMFTPRPSGLLEVDETSATAGGHAYAGITYTYRSLPGEGRGRKDLVVVQNSWGEGYGTRYYNRGGFVFIELNDMVKLLERRGEGAVPVKV